MLVNSWLCGPSTSCFSVICDLILLRGRRFWQRRSCVFYWRPRTLQPTSFLPAACPWPVTLGLILRWDFAARRRARLALGGCGCFPRP